MVRIVTSVFESALCVCKHNDTISMRCVSYGEFFFIMVGVSCGNISKIGSVSVFQVVNGEWDPNLGPLGRAGL